MLDASASPTANAPVHAPTRKVIPMTNPGRAPSRAHRGPRWLETARARLRDPAVLTIIAVTFLISAVGQGLLQAYVGDHSVITTTVLSVLGSVFLAAAIIVAARQHEGPTGRQRPPGRGAR
jgi:hypothetical protein